MAEHSLDPATFRLLFPAFTSVTVYPDVRLEAQWTMATAYLGGADGCLWGGNDLQQGLNLMTAHLLYLSQLLAEDTVMPGPLTQSRVDKVQVQFAPPPFKDGWEFWLGQSPYGQQLWALLNLKSAGGWFIGGAPERYGFRQAGGRFG